MRTHCSLAHDLKNQLTVILGRLELLSEMVPPDSAVAKQLGLIREAARSMAEQIETRECEMDSAGRNC